LVISGFELIWNFYLYILKLVMPRYGHFYYHMKNEICFIIYNLQLIVLIKSLLLQNVHYNYFIFIRLYLIILSLFITSNF